MGASEIKIGQLEWSAPMKKLPSLALAVAMLSTSFGLVAAEATDKSTAGTTSAHGKPTKDQMTGKVMEVNNQAKTFTVTAKGKTVVFSGATLPNLPKVGDVVDITYTVTPGGGPLTSINLNASKSNSY